MVTTKEILKILLNGGIDLSVIQSVTVGSEFNLRKSKRQNIVIIEHGRRTLLTEIDKLFKEYVYTIKQVYVGEIQNNEKYSRSFLVKLTDKERDELFTERNPCSGCTELKCNISKCQILKKL